MEITNEKAGGVAAPTALDTALNKLENSTKARVVCFEILCAFLSVALVIAWLGLLAELGLAL